MKEAALQDTSRVLETPVQTSASFWTAPVPWRFPQALLSPPSRLISPFAIFNWPAARLFFRFRRQIDFSAQGKHAFSGRSWKIQNYVV
jgi:hypothetical protein